MPGTEILTTDVLLDYKLFISYGYFPEWRKLYGWYHPPKKYFGHHIPPSLVALIREQHGG